MSRRSRSKTSQRRIVRDHYKTLVRPPTGKPQLRDYVEQLGLPVAAGAATWIVDWEVDAGTGAAIITVAGLFAALLFQLVIQLLGWAVAWADDDPTPGRVTSRRADLLEELSANAAYASIVASAAATVALLATISSTGHQERLLAAATVALLVHLGATLLMVTRRAYLLTASRLREARTGAGVENT